jgi:hypothetical protein
MSGNIIPLQNARADAPPNLAARLEDILALLHAIDAGELLAALPECEVARSHHQAALSLLAIAERELASLCDECASRR